MKRRSKYNRIKDIDPDEIFLDSENLPNFNKQQFEGRLEKPIPKRSIIFLSSFFVIVLGFFVWRTVDLQIVNGKLIWRRVKTTHLINILFCRPRSNIWPQRSISLE